VKEHTEDMCWHRGKTQWNWCQIADSSEEIISFSCKAHSANIHRVFKLQKKIIRIKSGVGRKSLYRGPFRKLNILPVACQCILSLMLFIVEKQNNIQTTLNIQGINTTNRNQLHWPSASLSCFQKGIFYSGIRIFNSLQDDITNLRNDRVEVKRELRRYLITHSCYSITEFLELNINGDDV
jgi:hypothetical protein